MSLVTQWRSMTHRNPIYPFAWEAVYQCGTRLAQFPRGRRPWLTNFDLRAVSAYQATHPQQYELFMAGEFVYTALLDRTRLEKLVILGHAYSPLDLPVPMPQSMQPLDEIVVKRTVDIHMPRPGQSRIAYTIRWFFGYRYGQDLCLLEIDADGNLYRTNTDRGQGTGAEDVRLKGGPLL